MFYRVSKEVDANSREAKSFLKKEETETSQENCEKQPTSSEPSPSVPTSFGSRYHPTPFILRFSVQSFAVYDHLQPLRTLLIKQSVF